MRFRRVFAPLLLLPFFHGLHARAIAPVAFPPEHAAAEALTTRVVVPVLQSALHAGTAVLEGAGSASGARLPTRLVGGGDGATPSDPVARVVRSRIMRSAVACLAFAGAVHRARTNIPTTYGNPPPAPLS